MTWVLTQGVELLAGEVWQVSKRNSQYFRSYLRKTTGASGVFKGYATMPWHTPLAPGAPVAG